MRASNIRESFKYAFLGIVYALETQRNIRIHFVAALIVIVLSMFLKISGIELALLIFAIALVIMTEMINTAIEAVVDLASPEIHPLAAVAKNVAAGAVLITALNAIIIAIIILGKYISSLF